MGIVKKNYEDHFAYSNGALDSVCGGAWTKNAGTVNVSSGKIVSGEANMDNSYYFAQQTNTIDQYICFRLVKGLNAGGGSGSAAVLRWDPSAGTSVYVSINSGFCWVCAYTNNSFSSGTEIGTFAFTETVAEGDYIGIAIVGVGVDTTIRIWKNPTFKTPWDVMNWDDSVDNGCIGYAEGTSALTSQGKYVGFDMWVDVGDSPTYCELDDFYFGDVPNTRMYFSTKEIPTFAPAYDSSASFRLEDMLEGFPDTVLDFDNAGYYYQVAFPISSAGSWWGAGYTLTRVAAWWSKVGLPTGNMSCFIMDGGGTNLGTATNTIDVSTLKTSPSSPGSYLDFNPSVVVFNFAGVALTNGVAYYIVFDIHNLTLTAANKIRTFYKNDGAVAINSKVNGGSWSTIASGIPYYRAFSSYSLWHKTSGVEARALLTPVKLGTAFVSSGNITGDTTSGQRYVLAKQFISPPLAEQYVGWGYLRGQMKALENNAGLNAYLAWGVKIIDKDGNVTQYLKEVSASAAAATPPEFTTSLTNRKMMDAIEDSIYKIPEFFVRAGDRIVVEIGYRKSSTTSTYYCNFQYGDASDTDLPIDTSTTSNYCSWLEFTQQIKFLTEPPSKPRMNSLLRR